MGQLAGAKIQMLWQLHARAQMLETWVSLSCGPASPFQTRSVAIPRWVPNQLLWLSYKFAGCYMRAHECLKLTGQFTKALFCLESDADPKNWLVPFPPAG